MSLTSDISDIVETKYPDAHYMLSSWFKANRASFDIASMTLDTPLIILNNEIPKDKSIEQNASILAGTRIIMQFLVKADDSVYATDLEMNAAIEELEIIADEIMIQIYQLDSIRLQGSEVQQYRITPKFKVYNSVLVGVEAEGRFKENQIRNWCRGGNELLSSDIAGATVEDGFIPDEETTIKLG